MKTYKLYLCGVDLQHELGEADCPTYPSIEILKKMRTCWKQCGIVEVEAVVTVKEWHHPQDFGYKDE